LFREVYPKVGLNNANAKYPMRATSNWFLVAQVPFRHARPKLVFVGHRVA
jgi:hypothetical protein